MKKIGFIGLGIMGKPMAKNLLKAGYELTCYDIAAPALSELVAAGAAKASNPAEVAALSEVVVTMLPNSPQVREVLCGENGVIESAKPGLIVVDMSSIDPTVSIALASELEPRGVTLIDAPVSGGEPKAVDGTVSIMAGGPQEAFNKVKDMLLCMGSSATLVGEIGSGNITKLANQIIVALNIAAVSEAMTLATKAGVNPESVYKAIRGGLAGSTVLDAKAPMMLARNFDPGFRIELHTKDLANAMACAHENSVPLPLTASVMEIMQALKADGREKCDHSAIVNYYEKISGVEVKAPE